MRLLIQRVLSASVSISGECKAVIGHGLLIFVGVAIDDDESDAKWLAEKVSQLRIFSDSLGKMNLSIVDVLGEVLVVSQFTLHASTKKGNRPSFINAAPPDKAIPLYHGFVHELQKHIHKPVQTGVFGADMNVELINEGPVTLWMDSKNRDY
jgi:D-aminoacyl-tRNA deacylase